jgi:hypothetical protein
METGVFQQAARLSNLARQDYGQTGAVEVNCPTILVIDPDFADSPARIQLNGLERPSRYET